MTRKNRINDPRPGNEEFAIIGSHAIVFECLNQIAIQQMRILTADDGIKRMESV